MKKILTLILLIAFTAILAQNNRQAILIKRQDTDSSRTKDGYWNLVLDTNAVLSTVDSNGVVTRYSIQSDTSKWTQSGDTLYPTNLSSKVGIGTALPERDLHVLNYIRSNAIEASGEVATIYSGTIGHNSLNAYSWGEVVVGIGNTDYTPNFASGFDETDRLFVIGNGNALVDDKSDALKIWKSGNAQFDNQSYTMKFNDTSGLVIPIGSSLPTGEEGALFSLTTDNSLQRNNGAYWQSVQMNHGIIMGCGDSTYSLSLTLNTPAPITNANNDLLSQGVDSTRGWYYSGDTIFASKDHGWVNFDLFIGVDGNNGSSLKPYIYKNGSSICSCGAEEELTNNKKVPIVFGTSTNVSAGDYFVPYLEDRGQTASTVINNVQFRVH